MTTPKTLAETLAERHKTLMLATEAEAEQAAQAGDKVRQSLASTESERHRAVYHAMHLIIRDEIERVDVMGLLAEALRVALAEADRIGIDDLGDGFPADVYEQMRAALIAAGYEVSE